MLTRILTTIQKDGAVFFPAVDERSLRFVSSLLASHRFPPLPLDYVALLKQTDGLSWNGVELYGTRANDREAKGYTLPGLIEANLEFSNAAPMQGKLLLGRAAEELFVYDTSCDGCRRRKADAQCRVLSAIRDGGASHIRTDTGK